MLSTAKTVVASSLLAFGHFSQGVAAQVVEDNSCIGESNNVLYQNCGRFGPLNVYWTVPQAGDQTNILFEREDNAWTSFGFTNLAPPNAMVGANHILGCADIDPADGLILNRSLAGVAGGLGTNALAAPNTITETRRNGICGIRFERPNVLPNAILAGDGDVATQNIVSGTENPLVWAFGQSMTPGQHAMDARGFGTQDFILNTGDITDAPVERFSCVGQTNGQRYQFCGTLGGGMLNVFWTNDNMTDVTTILFESADNGYTSFGFSGNAAGSGMAMIGANHIFGCHDFAGVDSPVDGLIPDRTLQGVAGGFGTNGLANLGTISEVRNNGVCGIEFERNTILSPQTLAQNVANAGPVENQNLDGQNVIVWARGPADIPAQHNIGRGAAVQDFLLGVGDITNTLPMPFPLDNPNPPIDNGVVPADNAAATWSVKLSMLVASVASAALRFL